MMDFENVVMAVTGPQGEDICEEEQRAAAAMQTPMQRTNAPGLTQVPPATPFYNVSL